VPACILPTLSASVSAEIRASSHRRIRHLSRQVHQAGGTGRFAAQPIFITGGEIQQASLRELVGATGKLSASRGLFFQK
jgi:hypothetical protein